MSKNTKAAIFDVDGTIFRSSLLIELVNVLIEYGHFDKSVSDEYERQHSSWQDRKGTYEEYINAVVKSFMNHIKGVEYDDFEEVSKIVIKRYKNHLYRYTRDLIKELKKKGYFLIAISQSPKGTLDKFCKTLGFDKVYGRFYELGPTDRFTGRVIDEDLISNKAAIVKRALAKQGLSISKSIGVGDTEGDISFLELVENPICFNPNANLYKYAKRHGWKIVVERKDVIYEIN